MLYKTEEEYVVAIAETQLAISRNKTIGHSHLNRSGGSERSTTEVLNASLMKDLALLQKEYADLVLENEGKAYSIRLGPGW